MDAPGMDLVSTGQDDSVSRGIKHRQRSASGSAGCHHGPTDCPEPRMAAVMGRTVLNAFAAERRGVLQAKLKLLPLGFGRWAV